MERVKPSRHSNQHHESLSLRSPKEKRVSTEVSVVSQDKVSLELMLSCWDPPPQCGCGLVLKQVERRANALPPRIPCLATLSTGSVDARSTTGSPGVCSWTTESLLPEAKAGAEFPNQKNKEVD